MSRGFAKMDPERVREIASMGGKALPNEARAYSRDRALAVKAGRKGGKAPHKTKRGFANDPEKASAMGRKGGLARSKGASRADVITALKECVAHMEGKE
jgi:general stress protein YciG